MRTKAHRHAHRGMTLIELMIVVAIVAILGSIAVANYRGYVLRSNRAEATSALLRIQAQQEKYYLNANTYTNNLVTLSTAASTERRLYTIAVELINNGEGYRATATAAGSQVADTECPRLSLLAGGQRLPDPGTSKCWQ